MATINASNNAQVFAGEGSFNDVGPISNVGVQTITQHATDLGGYDYYDSGANINASNNAQVFAGEGDFNHVGPISNVGIQTITQDSLDLHHYLPF